MSSFYEIDSFVERLQGYKLQLTSLCEALDQLRSVTDAMLTALEEDRAALAARTTARAEHAEHAEPAVLPVTADTAAPSTTTEPGASVATTDLTEAPENFAESCEIAAQAPAAETAATDAVADTATAPTAADEPIAVAPAADEAVTAELAALIDAEPVQVVPDAEPAAALEIAEVASDLAAAPAPAAAAEPEASDVLPLPEPAIAAAETPQTVAVAATEAATEAASEAAPALPATAADVVDLAARRRARAKPAPHRRGIAIMACVVVVAAAAVGLQQALHTDIARRIMEHGVCDGDALSASRNCALLSWLTL